MLSTARARLGCLYDPANMPRAPSRQPGTPGPQPVPPRRRVHDQGRPGRDRRRVHRPSMPGRRWSDGCIRRSEAKEKVKIERENQTLATITFQNYFRKYKKLSGMTGTPNRGLGVQQDLQPRCHRGADEPADGLVSRNRPHLPGPSARSTRHRQRHHRETVVRAPTLVGTVSIEKSERLSRCSRNAASSTSCSTRIPCAGSRDRCAGRAQVDGHHCDEHALREAPDILSRRQPRAHGSPAVLAEQIARSWRRATSASWTTTSSSTSSMWTPSTACRARTGAHLAHFKHQMEVEHNEVSSRRLHILGTSATRPGGSTTSCAPRRPSG